MGGPKEIMLIWTLFQFEMVSTFDIESVHYYIVCFEALRSILAGVLP